MAWSYDSSLPENKDKVRWLCGDTDTNDQLVQNEEILFALSDAGDNLRRAAAMVCDAIALKFANSLTLDKAPGSVSWDAAERAELFSSRAEKLRQEAITSGAGGGIFGGGISISDKQNREDDTDRVRSGFTSNMHRNRPVLNPTDPELDTNDW